MQRNYGKRICCLLVAAVLTAGLLSACGGQPDSGTKTETKKTQVTTEAESKQTQPVTTTESAAETPAESSTPAATEPETQTETPVSSWPEKDVLLLIPGAAGSMADIIANGLADAFNRSWGAYPKMFNDSTPGKVLLAANDGYTLELASYPTLISSYVKTGTPITYREYTNIAGIVKNPYVILVKPASFYQSLQELIAAGREKTVYIGVLKGGDIGAMLVKKLNERCGTQFEIKEYSNRPELEMSGIYAAITPASLFYQKDSYCALVVLDDSPSFVFPDAPTVDKAGVAELQDFFFQARYGLVAPAALDQKAADRIGQALSEAVSSEDFLAVIRDLGYDVVLLSGDGFTAYLQSVEDDMKGFYTGQ